MTIPGLGHPITLTPAATRWQAAFNGHLIADSAAAIVLREASYPPVVYFPRQDVSMEVLARTDRSTHCPFKGDASYFTLSLDGRVAENAVWTSEAPYPAMAQIEGRVAFYPHIVEVHAVDDAAVNPRHIDVDVDQAVLHTDSGSGVSQREHWAPNVPGPERGAS